MSVQATIVRHNRRVQAAPGGAHDRLIRFLLVALPICIGAVSYTHLTLPTIYSV